MTEVLVIEGTQVERLYYNEQPVLSLPMVDEVHQRPQGTARRNFNENREHFILGEDYYDLPYEEWSILNVRNSYDQGGDSSVQNDAKKGRKGNMIFLTMQGYLMIAKSMKDALSWKIQRILVKSYFKLKEIQAFAEKNLEVMSLKDALITTQRKCIELLEKKTRRRRLTEAERKRILELYEQNLEVGEIAIQVGRSKASVCNFIKYRSTSGYKPLI